MATDPGSLLRQALQDYERATRLRPEQVEAWYNRGNVLQALKRFEEAVRSYDRAIQLRPDLAEPFNNRGVALQGLARPEEALQSYGQAIRLRPAFAEAFNNRGVTLQGLGRLEQALQDYDEAIRLKPEYAEAINNRGNALKGLRRPEAALRTFDQLIQLLPDFAEAYNNRGVVLLGLDRLEEARQDFDQAIRLRPEYAEAFNNRGNALKGLERLEEALRDYDQALRSRPDFADSFNNRGVALLGLGQPEQALRSCDQAILLNPDFAEAFLNRGNALQDLDQIEQALGDYDHALELQPESAQALNNRGDALRGLNRLDEARSSYHQAIRLDPGAADPHWNLALLELLAGNFQEGWRSYEWGWAAKTRGRQPDFPQPLWLGAEPLAGRTILVRREQGLGDLIQLCRYLPLLGEAGAKVLLEAPRPLAALLATLARPCTLLEPGQPLPPFDLHCPIMSLPLAFGTTLETVPARTPYLSAPAPRRTKWRQKLGPRTRMRVGVAWSGAAHHTNDARRSLRLEQLLPLLGLEVELHSLQKQYSDSDAALLAGLPRIHQHQVDLEDLADTAALAAEMDLVISVDTSVAHLAGAIGKPVWILLPFMPDFRWLLDRQDSPWYPTARLFRQPERGDWASVILSVAGQLEILIGPPQSGNSHR